MLWEEPKENKVFNWNPKDVLRNNYPSGSTKIASEKWARPQSAPQPIPPKGGKILNKKVTHRHNYLNPLKLVPPPWSLEVSLISLLVECILHWISLNLGSCPSIINSFLTVCECLCPLAWQCFISHSFHFSSTHS